MALNGVTVIICKDGINSIPTKQVEPMALKSQFRRND